MKRPFLIGIGGTQSGVGKTTLAVTILRSLKVFSAASGGWPERWGAVKYTRTELFTSIVDDPELIAMEGKDTARLLDAGAEEVLWVQSPPAGLGEVLPIVLSRLGHLDAIVIEGNSAIEFSKPDIVLFMCGRGKILWKQDIERFFRTADLIIFEEGAELPEIVKGKRCIPWDQSPGGEKATLKSIAELLDERYPERGAAQEGR